MRTPSGGALFNDNQDGFCNRPDCSATGRLALESAKRPNADAAISMAIGIPPRPVVLREAG
jgi:hypothetical protein